MTEMLQKTENVSKNVANENSQDLTQQWEKGELPNGWYWVESSIAEGIYAYTAEYPTWQEAVNSKEFNQ